MNSSSLFWGVMFGVVGLGFFVYGRKQKAIVPLGCGLALMVFPYFVTNTYVLVGVGVGLMAAPFFFEV